MKDVRMWLLPGYESIKLNSSYPMVESTSLSINRNEKLSLGQALLRLEKLMHTLSTCHCVS